MDASDQAAIDQPDDRRWTARPPSASSARTPSWASPWPPPRPPPSPHDLPLYRYLGGVGARTLPVPADEHPERRRARRLQRRYPGVHDRPAGRPDLRRGAPHGAEVFHALKKVLKSQGLHHRRRRRGRLRPEPRVQRGSARAHPGGHRAGRLQARASRCALALDCGRQRVLRQGDGQATPSKARARRFDARGARRLLRSLVRQVPDRLHRGRLRRERLGRLEALDREAGQEGPARRRRPLRHQRHELSARHRRRGRQLHPDQGQPDRLAHRDPRGRPHGPPRRLHRPS